MRVIRFSYLDHRTGWRLEDASVDQLNLLVGVSGVGKTKVLRSLRTIADVACGVGPVPPGIAWTIDFEHAGVTYRWEGESDTAPASSPVESITAPPDSGDGDPLGQLVRERIVATEKPLVDRDGDRFVFEGQSLPKLKRQESALVLLENEDSIKPVRAAFRRMLFSIAPALLVGIPFHPLNGDDISRRVETYRKLPQGPDGFSAFKEKLADSGLTNLSEYANLAAYYLQEAFPAEFQKVASLFCEIFPTVRQLQVRKHSALESVSAVVLDVAMLEEGASAPIPQSEMSSGMLRTLVHLIEISLSPPGSVIIVDEFENSLGVNCMPDVTRLMQTRDDCQFILTSHHPYVINHIPPASWRLVTRKGSVVRIRPARELPDLQIPSHQQAFLRLINLPEYEVGVS